ncbi:hypothetical protein [Aureimonas leprariae]|uniref:Uncharacterized protein n=1 Tax=Plantimonas leprariae TaxID=2615207 RepID=A0A7V7PRH5_9HYPH|nr:hypothetical protein [Aureimonas leprariae]KAB0681343.1 hypothetical protein F6X38_05510 [Aureimonas leprariae]
MPLRPMIFTLLGIVAFLAAIAAEFSSPLLMLRPSHGDADAPGIGIAALACLDLVFVYTLIFLAVDYFPGIRAVFARVQGIATLVLSIFALLASILLAFAAFTLLMLMVSLLLAVPFGTIAYFALWGDFDTGTAKAILGFAMTMKLVGLGLLLGASFALLKNKGLVLLAVCSLGLTFVLGLLQSIPPGFLVSITDAIGGLVTLIVVIVWTLIFLIGSLPAIVRAVRSAV